jgi:UDP-N-acetylglucosamine 1-carboxyvinyltransferase
MGASIKTEDRCAIITGKKQLRGAPVIATDLRAGAAVVLAGLVAEGNTVVSEIYHIERGYEHFVEKLNQLGGLITKVKEEQQV